MKTNDAVIYCRVASLPVGGEARAFDAQAQRCRAYAAARGYRVTGEFADHGSGRTVDRPGLNALLTFVERNDPGLRVLVDGVERIGRNIEGHLAVTTALASMEAVLEDASGVRP